MIDEFTINPNAVKKFIKALEQRATSFQHIISLVLIFLIMHTYFFYDK